VHNVWSQAGRAIFYEHSEEATIMYRSVCLILMFSIIPPAAMSQTASTDSQTLQAILSELRQLAQPKNSVSLAAISFRRIGVLEAMF
jgi:hypothetical protein